MEAAFAERLVKAGAEAAMPFFRSGLSYKQKSGPHDLVTAADIAAGERKSVSFKMDPGHYALICNLPGHYAGGMWADFTVK